ncbi:hypothetical protein [Desulfuromonas acetoxidans]|uniref:hypothetical protein n=1 Tax=Desulfuromonas acetoxidans TaxID=891 RepID=UPI00293040FB
MQRNSLFKTLIFLAICATLLTAGCDGDGDHYTVATPDATETLVLGEATTDLGNTTFRQTVDMQDTDTNEYFPGQANIWNISSDFSLSDGGDDQFDGVMRLNVDATSFTSQDYTDLTFYTPTVSVDDGVKVAAVVEGLGETYDGGSEILALNGTYSVAMNMIYDARLAQVIDLSTAVAPVNLTWQWDLTIDDGSFSGTDAKMDVVLRSTADGSVVATLYSIDSGEETDHTVSLNDYVGQQVVLSFEYSSSGDYGTLIDDISIVDGNTQEFVSNGDFETGNLTGWTTNEPEELQNFTSAAETIADLTVTRSFYTVPDKSWGRWVDVFTNETAAAITTTIQYEHNLGSDDYGILYLTPGTDGQALTGWDAEADSGYDPGSSSNDRDFAFVFGDVTEVLFTSATGLDTGDGSDSITHNYNVTVEPGETIAIVNFVVMNGIDTNMTATDETALATAIDAEVTNILSDFWTDGQYRTGMTQAQIDAIINL